MALIRTFTGHTAPVLAAVFMPGNRFVRRRAAMVQLSCGIEIRTRRSGPLISPRRWRRWLWGPTASPWWATNRGMSCYGMWGRDAINGTSVPVLAVECGRHQWRIVTRRQVNLGSSPSDATATTSPAGAPVPGRRCASTAGRSSWFGGYTVGKDVRHARSSACYEGSRLIRRAPPEMGSRPFGYGNLGVPVT